MIESSDDETETMLAVSNYTFVDQRRTPISFSELPVRWNDNERLDGHREQIFLHGSGDGGLRAIYKQVLEWKFIITDAIPEISVLSKENRWILLEKPKKSYEGIIRTILITVHCLYLMKNDPDLSRKSLWGQLSRIFSSYDPRPSENDLLDHIALIGEAVRRDKTLSQSACLITFLKDQPQKKDFWTMERPGFIVDDHIEVYTEEEEFDEDDALFDTVCAICDNGGELLCCEGRCLRSFHATVNAGSESACVTLGYSLDRINAMPSFFCGNCQYKQHQCFACGKLGSSVKSAGAEVFPCVSATCGHFYHPHCVAKLLHNCNAAEAEKFEKKIAAGESFTCPIHKCYICRQGENKNDFDSQFAVCRRCPKSYHRKCMPREINFEGQGNGRLMPRAWDNLIPKQILIYCLDHEIDKVLGTPMRNHLKIPGDWQNKKKYASEQPMRKDRIVPKDSSVVAEVSPSNANTVGSLAISNKKKVGDLSKIPQKTTISLKVNTDSMDGHGLSLGNRLHSLFTKSSKGVRIGKEEMEDCKGKNTMSNELPTKVKKSYMLSLDADSQRRILALATDAASMITMKDITENSKLPITHSNSSKIAVDKGITLGKVEGSIEAIREALRKLESGYSVEDAKTVCEPQLLHQIFKWKIKELVIVYRVDNRVFSNFKNLPTKLKVYLAPFIYGKRYTSYGRHFTKVEKLKEIVNIVHCYVEEGDMIVDFCCGANDFSCLMKNKMDETGKKCFYKNYDLIQAKNDFNFEKRDWMDVHPQELLAGSKLIMGLNPPFGVNASLANKFINKALQFKPKLLILIVPRETERLDRKYNPYDLVWEDYKFLAGKSFYLPGSVDANDNQIEDSNLIPPPLYLWSRPDWTATNRKIAEQNGHLTELTRWKSQNIEIQHETNGWKCMQNPKKKEKKKKKRNEGSLGVQPGNQLLGKRKREEQYDDPFLHEMRIERSGYGSLREMVEKGEILQSTDIVEEESCCLMDNLYGHMGEGSVLKVNSDKFLYGGQLDKILNSQCSTSSSYLAGAVPGFEPPLPPPPPPPAYLQDFNHFNSSSYYGIKMNTMESRNLTRSQMFPPPVGFAPRPQYAHHFYSHNSIGFTPSPPPPPPPPSYKEIFNSDTNIGFHDPPPPGVLPYEEQQHLSSDSFNFAPLLPHPPGVLPYEEQQHLSSDSFNFAPLLPHPPGVLPYEEQRLSSDSFNFAPLPPPPPGSNPHLSSYKFNFTPRSNSHFNTYNNTGWLG